MEIKRNMRYEPMPQALLKWNPAIKAAKKDEDYKHAVNVYDYVGAMPDGSGATTKLFASVLRNAGGDDVVVNINSPGGDFFEGLAIYNMLKDYEGKVKVRVLGLAASAASVIAMAGDELEMAEGAFLMIHNAWTLAMGNRHDLTEAAATLKKFDDSMASIYAARTGFDPKSVAKMMDAETWIGAQEAVDMRFASAVMGSDAVDYTEEEHGQTSALKKADRLFAQAGLSRSQARDLLKELTAKPSAGSEPEAKPSAGDTSGEAVLAELNKLIGTLKQNLK